MSGIKRHQDCCRDCYTDVGAGTSAGLVSKPSSDPVSPQSLASYAGAASRRIASDPTQWTLTMGLTTPTGR
jgi:hypothetical protein